MTHRNPRRGLDIVNKLSKAFDPEAQKLRDEERSNRSLQSAQFLTLSQQIRDATTTIENLRSQIAIVQGHAHDADRARDRAELKLEMMQMSGGSFGGNGHSAPTRGRSSQRDHHAKKRKCRGSAHYADGGHYVWYVTDESDSSERPKARHVRSPSRHHHSHARNRHHIPLAPLSSHHHSPDRNRYTPLPPSSTRFKAATHYLNRSPSTDSPSRPLNELLAPDHIRPHCTTMQGHNHAGLARTTQVASGTAPTLSHRSTQNAFGPTASPYKEPHAEVSITISPAHPVRRAASAELLC